jgi:hypothetical protein
MRAGLRERCPGCEKGSMAGGGCREPKSKKGRMSGLREGGQARRRVREPESRKEGRAAGRGAGLEAGVGSLKAGRRAWLLEGAHGRMRVKGA